MYVVVNHLHLTMPIDDLRPALEQDGVTVLAAQPGFRRFALVREAPDRATALIFWDTEADAINGGKQFGPTWFAEHVAPYLASDQVRTIGEVVIDHQL